MSWVLRHRLRPDGPEIVVHVFRTARRNRTIALQLSPDGRVTLRAPLHTKRAKLEELLRKKALWLDSRLSGAWGRIPPPSPPHEFMAGETFHFLGRQHRLKLTIGNCEDSVRLEGEFLHVMTRGRKPVSRTQIRSRLKAWFTTQAMEFLPERVARWTPKLSIRQQPRVLIADQSRRWASCGKSAVLRFNWRLMGAPISLIDYVILHELCHLLHPDHSPAFWRKLSEVMPDRLKREEELYAAGGRLGF